MVDETELTLPTISMPRITALRDKLTAKLMQFAGHQANTEVFQAVVDALVAVMPAEVNKTTVQNSVLSLRGVTLTDDVLFSTCWRLSSSVDRLKLGIIHGSSHFDYRGLVDLVELGSGLEREL